MGNKEFKRKFMHPTRRKLADMVLNGSYDKNTLVGYTKDEQKREVGETWEDEHHRYEKKNGYTIKTGKNHDVVSKVREYIQNKTTCKNSECKRNKKNDKDRKLILKTGYCIDCLAKLETEIRHAGIWDEYSKYRIYSNMIIQGKIRLEQLKQAHDEVKDTYEYVNDDGTSEVWHLPNGAENAKKEMKEMIEYGENELKELDAKLKEVYKVIKDNNYEHVL